jgi:hypothetical protein
LRGNGNLVCQYHGPSASSGGVYWSEQTGAHEVHSCIFDEFRATETGALLGMGFPVNDMQAIGGGHVNYFRNDLLACNPFGPSRSTGAIYWSAATGAHRVPGCLFSTPGGTTPSTSSTDSSGTTARSTSSTTRASAPDDGREDQSAEHARDEEQVCSLLITS